MRECKDCSHVFQDNELDIIKVSKYDFDSKEFISHEQKYCPKCYSVNVVVIDKKSPDPSIEPEVDDQERDKFKRRRLDKYQS